MQFYETYRNLPKLAPLVRELSWTHNLLIMSRSKRDEEREFYLRVGVLLCATKNDTVVEYALSRTMSPAVVAEYQTRLPDKKMLEAKLHEFYELASEQAVLPVPKIDQAAQAKRSAKKRRPRG